MIKRKNTIKRIKKIYSIILTLWLISFFSCGENTPRVDSGLNEKLNFNSEEYHSQLHDFFTKDDLAGAFNNSGIQYYDTLKLFFSERDYQPLFIKSYEEKSFIDSLLNILGKADEHGLNPESYHFTRIKNEYYNSTKDNLVNTQRYQHLATTEILVSAAILKYAYHMRYGIVNPTEIFLDSYYLPVPDSASRNLFEPLKKADVIQYLVDIQPKSKKYTELQAALIKFADFRNLDWQQIKFTANKKIKIGDSDSSLAKISQRLIALGFFDSSKAIFNQSAIYDSIFADAVKKFQKANGLNADGVISKNSIDKLNVTPDEYIKKIKVNLERFRWFDYSDTLQYILVNIPDFRLHMIENGEEVFDITVCAGRKRYSNFEKQYLAYKQSKHWRNKPEDWETPILYGQISHLVLNPTWTVPFSIMREEIASKVQRDSTYLKRADFRVYKNGSLITHSEVNVADLSSGNVRYTMIQNPGAGNALGKIKFMFDNPFGVYLHDTPTRAPFKYENRAVSHGCVRVEKPMLLAEHILNNNSNWTIDYLKIEIGNKADDKAAVEEFKQKRSELRKGSSYGATTDVKLEKPIPLFIDYITAWVDKDGVVNFRDDVYRQDKIIMDNLFLKE